jgi:hypothetical protein
VYLENGGMVEIVVWDAGRLSQVAVMCASSQVVPWEAHSASYTRCISEPERLGWMRVWKLR